MSGGRQPTVKQVARGLVVSLINWEISAAEGESMTTACDRFGAAAVQDALRSIQDELQRAGVRYLDQPSEEDARDAG